MNQVKGYPKPCIIRCPKCEVLQLALETFDARDLFPGYSHECACGYLITESEWEAIDLGMLTGRRPSRLTVTDIERLEDRVRHMLKRGDDRLDCGGLLIALEDLKANVEASHV